jgi:NAD(P)-dependent dehydrogenase (short-subunit alcohol dehydrogenase family)
VNVHSAFLVTQGILPYMMEQKKGRIINIASTAGKWGSRGQSAYNAAKHAVVGLRGA